MKTAVILKTGLMRLTMLSACIAFVGIVALAVMYANAFSDPRWRIFDINSRQATEGEIYHVADIPSIRTVKLTGERTLRFTFAPPIETTEWTVIAESDGSVNNRGPLPEIRFTGEPSTDTFRFVPDGITLPVEIEVTISFYPTGMYRAVGLSWPDNYYSLWASIPFSLTDHRSVDEWAGLADDDPDVVEAKRIMGNAVDMNAPVLERSAQVFDFIMDKTGHAGGTPTDEVLDASPLKTYRMFESGEGKGFCENRALIYYLFANAAGVKTRLVDMAGKFGPLKLTGHYFCESWDPATHRWFLVDPQSSAARVMSQSGTPLNTVEIKHLFDTDSFGESTVLFWNGVSGSLETRPIESFYTANKYYYTGQIVIAFKCGYPRNATFNPLKTFFTRPTLLYAPFRLPRLYISKILAIWCAVVGIAGTCLFGAGYGLIRKGADR